MNYKYKMINWPTVDRMYNCENEFEELLSLYPSLKMKNWLDFFYCEFSAKKQKLFLDD